MQMQSLWEEGRGGEVKGKGVRVRITKGKGASEVEPFTRRPVSTTLVARTTLRTSIILTSNTEQLC